MGNFALAFLIVLILLFIIGYLPLKMEEGNIKRGDIFKRMDYKNKNTDPFQNDNNEYARIIDKKKDEDDVLWVKYVLYKKDEIGVECTEQALSFLMRYIKVE